MIGELSVFDGGLRSATAIVAEDVEAVVAPADAVLRTLQDSAAAQEVISVLARRLRYADRARIEFATLNTLGRVALRLLELSERFGQESPEGTLVLLPLSQDQLASWCGASREATVKALASLRSLKVITTGRRNLIVHDDEALRRQARGLAYVDPGL